jgi:hypothetical protein
MIFLPTTHMDISRDSFAQIIQTLGLDLRSMAFYRFLLGIVVLYDLYFRWSEIYAWYTDEGMVQSRSH